MRSLSDSLTYPTNSENWIPTIVIGGVLTFLGFLVVPFILVYGYLVSVIRGCTAGNPEPPAFEEWGKLFVDGLQALIIGFIYMLIPFIVAFATVGSAIFAMATGSDAAIAAGIGSMFLGLGLSALLALVFTYIGVAGLVNFAREERFGAAFDVAVLKSVVLHRDYAVAWVLSIVILIGASIIAGMLNVIPLIGAVIGAFITFYALVAAATLWADGFADAADQSDAPMASHGTSIA